MGVVYPLQAISSRSGGFSTPDAWTLDGSEYYRKNYPELMAAVDRMWAVSPGVLAEAIAPDGGDYSIYGRVAMLTGMPAVLGWRFHEVQWRGGDTEIGPRQADVALLYETLDWRVAQGVIDKYNIKYIYMGDLEQETYDLQEEKFYQHLELIFQEGKVVVFQTELE